MSEDALDRPRPGGKMSKSAKRAYARDKFVEELIVPSAKHAPPAWMSDPSLLPKKPPGRT